MIRLGRVLLLAVLLAVVSPDAANSTEAPHVFTALQQCAVAQQLGLDERRAGASVTGDWLLGLAALCRGLRHDDAWALEAALPLLDAVALARPSDVFALIDRADAWCVRYPAAQQTVQAVESALSAATPSSLGAALAAQRERLRDNLVLIRARAADLPWSEVEAVRRTRAEAASPWELASAADAGPAAARWALGALAARVAADPGDLAARLAAAEVLRGRAPHAMVAAAYADLQRRACGAEGLTAEGNPLCDLARLRLRQLAAYTSGDDLFPPLTITP